MSEFRFQFEWEDAPRPRAPELDATWARFEIHVGEESLTRVEVKRTCSVRTGIYVPLFPVAEWMVSNWFFLWDEWRDDPFGRHNLLAAREGFALPDLLFRPTESQMELSWKRSAAPYAGLEFLSQGSAVMRKAVVREECSRLIEAVLDRLSRVPRESSGIASQLAGEWAAVKDVLLNQEQKSFCERAARLGYDPFDLNGSAAEQIEQLELVLPEPVIDDFCDAIPLAEAASGAKLIRSFIDDAARNGPPEGRWAEVREQARHVNTGVLWRDGYTQAGIFRSFLGLNGHTPVSLERLLDNSLGSFESRDFAAPARIEGISCPAADLAPVFGVRFGLREEKRRFVLSRAVGDFLTFGQTALVTRGHSEHQQRNRAFAAEFLAPAESIRKLIPGGTVDEEDVDELAAEFQVSTLVIRYQIQNHRLAEFAT
jgi:hypothetical protein